MYIEPNTNIRLLKNVPLDNTYQHTYYFTDKTSQSNHFLGYTKHILTEQTYQRSRLGVSRVGIKAEDLFDCNYMMFQNTNFGSKWFYAFINNVEYVNNTVSEIRFEIDVMQTWFFDYELRDSFVQREHSSTDEIGDNLVPEGLELGEYVSDDFDGTQKMDSYKTVVASTVQGDGSDAVGGGYGGVYSGLHLNVFDSFEDVNTWIDELTGDAKSDGIVSVFMMPSAFITGKGEPPMKYTFAKTKQHSNIGGYVPKNNKLFTYPYNFLYVTNLEGTHAEFHYEYFEGENCNFGLVGDFSCNPNVVLFPTNYKGVLANYDEKMVLGGFPQCSWNTDSYKAWLAQNSGSLFSNTFSGASRVALRSLIDPVGAGVSLLSSVVGTIGQLHDHSIMPPQAKGSSGSVTQVALKIKDFAFMHKHITKEFAMIIDRYFHMFGYATNKVKVPNRSVRSKWNYVKTIGCNAYGSVPTDDMGKIKSIYDSGITFWKTSATVGKYTDNDGSLLSNSI